jgi:methyl-accepting chemotaxis protein
METDREIVRNDIKKWTYLFAENVRISLNSLMREGRVDIRFTIFDGLKNEIDGLKGVRIIRSKKVDELFKLANEKDVIPHQEKRLKTFKAELAELGDELADTDDRYEREDLQGEMASLQRDILRTEGAIKDLLKPKKVDKREMPQDDIDRQVLKSGEVIYKFEGDAARVVIPYKVKKKGCSETSGCHTYAKEGDVLGGISLEFSLADVNRQIESHNTSLIALAVLKLAVILGVIMLILIFGITRPVGKVAAMLKDVAEGKGDLTRRITITSKDEVGLLSRWFNEFMVGMQKLVRNVASTSEKISTISDEVNRASTALHESAQTQINSIEETSSSIEEMTSNIRSVAYETDEQLKATENVSSSVMEVLASIAEVSENSDQLAMSADRTASSINEIAASLGQVSTNVNTLFVRTEEVVSATTQINSAVKEVSAHAKQKAVLAEKVRENASTLGMDAVKKTKSGMEKIKKEVAVTSGVIDRLLSFNAAIIAAQAGEHGKGFAVVAEEVKNLSKKTASSTKEISSLIKMVQSEVGEAKKSMKNSSVSVEEGVNLSMAASGALSKIMDSAESSLDMAKKVEIATAEQTTVLGKVSGSIQEINLMVEEIKRATDEQKVSSEDIIKVTEDMRERTKAVQRSTREQSRENDTIVKIVSDLTKKMQIIAKAMTEQKTASNIIVETVQIMQDEIEKNVVLSEQLNGSVKELNSERTNLNKRVGSFKID